jgi:uncharacterized protein
MSYAVRWATHDPADRQAFVRVMVPYLAKRETHTSLLLAILDGIARGLYDDPLLGLAEDEWGDIAAVALRTPPYDLLVAAGDVPAAREALLASLLEQGSELPGMVGPLPDVEAAAGWWAGATGRVVRRVMHQGQYRLRAVRDAERAPGRMRFVDEDDRALVVAWLDAFSRSWSHAAPRRDPDEAWAALRRDEARRIALWLGPDEQPVCLAGVSGRTPTGARIAPVYTPPEARTRGYAEALVAELCRAELARGARAIYLVTNLADGRANGVYRRIGFEMTGEAAQVAFDPRQE